MFRVERSGFRIYRSMFRVKKKKLIKEKNVIKFYILYFMFLCFLVQLRENNEVPGYSRNQTQSRKFIHSLIHSSLFILSFFIHSFILYSSFYSFIHPFILYSSLNSSHLFRKSSVISFFILEFQSFISLSVLDFQSIYS